MVLGASVGERSGEAMPVDGAAPAVGDDLVRRTAAAGIVPVQFRTAPQPHRFWVTDADRERLEGFYGDPLHCLGSRRKISRRSRRARIVPLATCALRPWQ